MVAKRKEIERIELRRNGGGLEKVRLNVPEEESGGAIILGEGPGATPKIIEILKELGVV